MELEHKDIRESSGIAMSWRHENVLWTHNDSGDKERIFAFDPQGKHLSEVKVKGVDHEDWEDIASFEFEGKGQLLIGDVGDNALRRKSVRLYRVNEPKLDNHTIKVDQTWKVKYPDGPRNCEAIGVDVAENLILLASKVKGFEAEVYSVPLDFGDDQDLEVKAKRLGAVPVPVITGMDIHPETGDIIFVTYADAFIFSRVRDPKSRSTDWEKTLKQTPKLVRMPVRRQGESICFDRFENVLWLTSEKRPTPLLRVVLPEVK